MSEFFLVATCDEQKTPMVLHLTRPPEGVERLLIGRVQYDEICMSHGTDPLAKSTKDHTAVMHCHPRSVILEVATRGVDPSRTARQRAIKLLEKGVITRSKRVPRRK